MVTSSISGFISSASFNWLSKHLHLMSQQPTTLSRNSHVTESHNSKQEVCMAMGINMWHRITWQWKQKCCSEREWYGSNISKTTLPCPLHYFEILSFYASAKFLLATFTVCNMTAPVCSLLGIEYNVHLLYIHSHFFTFYHSAHNWVLVAHTSNNNELNTRCLSMGIKSSRKLELSVSRNGNHNIITAHV